MAAFAVLRKKFPHAELHIVGPSKGEDIAGVIWHGFLSRQDAHQWAQFQSILSDATLFVLPSLYEPLGIAPLEAMGWGIPAVVTGKWALRENVLDGIHGAHCPVGNSTALSEILIDLLEKPDQLANMGIDARAHVQQNFSWHKVAERLRALHPSQTL